MSRPERTLERFGNYWGESTVVNETAIMDDEGNLLPAGQVGEMQHLLVHDLGRPDAPMEHGLVQDYQQHRWPGPVQDRLPFEASSNHLLQLVLHRVRPGGKDRPELRKIVWDAAVTCAFAVSRLAPGCRKTRTIDFPG